MLYIYMPWYWVLSIAKSPCQLDLNVYFPHYCLCLFAPTEAEEAVKALDGRWFGGRVIKCEVYDDDKFQNNDLSH